MPITNINPTAYNLGGLTAATYCKPTRVNDLPAIYVDSPHEGVFFKKASTNAYELLFFTNRFANPNNKKSDNKKIAIVGAILSPLYVPVKAIVSITVSLFNIISFGQIAKRRGFIEGTFLSRCKAVVCSALSILTTPANMVAEEIAILNQIRKPAKITQADLVAAHLWTGFIIAWRKTPTAPQSPETTPKEQ